MGVEFDNVVRDLDYYLNSPTLNKPEFLGNAAVKLGIKGTYSEEAARRLYQGQQPATGERLPGIRMVKNRKGAMEITFNRDKATTVIKLIAQDDRVDAVEEKAELKAVREVERQARVRVRKASEIERSKTKMPKGWKYPERRPDNLAYLRYAHYDSRAGDPHDHSHWLIFMASFDKEEGEWKSPEFRYIDRKGISEIYHKELAKGLRKLGYNVTWDGKEIKLHGVDDDLVQEFSTRGRAIKAKQAELDKGADTAGRNRMSSKSRQKVGLHDRPDKEFVAYDIRRRGWLSRITGDQFSRLIDLVNETTVAKALRHWHKQLSQHAAKLRAFSNFIEAESPGMAQGDSRGGFSR